MAKKTIKTARFRDSWNYKLTPQDCEIIVGPSLTVPGQSWTISELMDKFQQNLMALEGLGKSPYYAGNLDELNEDKDFDITQDRDFDLSDASNYLNERDEKIRDFERSTWQPKDSDNTTTNEKTENTTLPENK